MKGITKAFTTMAKEIKISKVELQYYSSPERRRIKVHLSNGHTGYISRCWESWEIYGNCTIDDKQVIMPIAEQYNGWLHEGLSEDGY